MAVATRSEGVFQPRAITEAFRAARVSDRRRSKRAFSSAFLAIALVVSAAISVVTLATTALPAGAATTPKTYIAETLNEPTGLAFDQAGNLYIANIGDGTISVLPKTSGTLFGRSVTADTAARIVSGLSEPDAVAFDPAGNLYIVDYVDSTVLVFPRTSGTIFGHSVTADTVTTIASGLDNPDGLGFDPAGNLYIANLYAGTVSVLPKSGGTLFGQSVSADTVATIASTGDTAAGLAFDPAGNLYVADEEGGTVSVLPKTSGTLSGHSVTAHTLATIVSGLNGPAGLAFDQAGNLYIAIIGDGTISVLPKTSGTLFGHSVSADTVATVAAGLSDPIEVTLEPAFDQAGNLYIWNEAEAPGTVSELPKSSGTLFGQPVSADTVATLVAPGLDEPTGLAFDSAGNLYIANYGNETVTVLPKANSTLVRSIGQGRHLGHNRHGLERTVRAAGLRSGGQPLHRQLQHRHGLGPPQGQRHPLRPIGHRRHLGHRRHGRRRGTG